MKTQDAHDKISLPEAVRNTIHVHTITTDIWEEAIEAGETNGSVVYDVQSFGLNMLDKAMRSSSTDEFGFHHRNLSKYIPTLPNALDFATNPNFLGNMKVEVRAPTQEMAENISQIEKINALVVVIRNLVDPIKELGVVEV